MYIAITTITPTTTVVSRQASGQVGQVVFLSSTMTSWRNPRPRPMGAGELSVGLAMTFLAFCCCPTAICFAFGYDFRQVFNTHHFVAGVAGFEPATSHFGGGRTDQLCYTPAFVIW